MKKVFLILLILVIVLSITFPTFAHSGRTDSQGGHHDRSNGSIITIMAILRTITQMGNVPIPTHRAEDAQQGKPPEL